MQLTSSFPVETKEHYRRVVALLLRKWRKDSDFTERTNTMLATPRQVASLLKSLFIDILELTELEAESLISAYGKAAYNTDFRSSDEALTVALDKIRQRKSLDKLLPYVDSYMGLGNEEEAKVKFLGLVSGETDYGYPGWEKESHKSRP